MPSGRDSFRRNRVAPSVLLYFTIERLKTAPKGQVIDKARQPSPSVASLCQYPQN
jgi:hypothetical protein